MVGAGSKAVVVKKASPNSEASESLAPSPNIETEAEGNPLEATDSSPEARITPTGVVS
jgi:hypothetical protein